MASRTLPGNLPSYRLSRSPLLAAPQAHHESYQDFGTMSCAAHAGSPVPAVTFAGWIRVRGWIRGTGTHQILPGTRIHPDIGEHGAGVTTGMQTGSGSGLFPALLRRFTEPATPNPLRSRKHPARDTARPGAGALNHIRTPLHAGTSPDQGTLTEPPKITAKH
jgi:hypothetical protein